MVSACCFHCTVAQLQSLAGELRSFKFWGVAKRTVINWQTNVLSFCPSLLPEISLVYYLHIIDISRMHGLLERSMMKTSLFLKQRLIWFILTLHLFSTFAKISSHGNIITSLQKEKKVSFFFLSLSLNVLVVRLSFSSFQFYCWKVLNNGDLW